MNPVQAVAARPWGEVAMRTLAVVVVSTLASAGVAVLAFGDVRDLSGRGLDLLALLAFVALVVAGTTAVHHRTRRGAVWRGRAARWWYAALVSLWAVLAVGVVALLTALLVPAGPADAGADASTLGVAFVVWLFVLVFTGLPAWTFLMGVAVGPPAPKESGTGEDPRPARRSEGPGSTTHRGR